MPAKRKTAARNTPAATIGFEDKGAATWAMACMNMTIHDMEGQIEIGDTFKNPKFRDKGGKLRTFDRVIANPKWNHDGFTEADYNISPSRYIHTSDAETYRPIAEIVGELKVIEAEAKETDKALGGILKQLGIGA